MIVYVLFFGTGMAYAVVSRKMGAWSYKAGIAVALVAGFAFGVVQHGPCHGLEKSGEPGVLQRAHAEPTQPELKPNSIRFGENLFVTSHSVCAYGCE